MERLVYKSTINWSFVTWCEFIFRVFRNRSINWNKFKKTLYINLSTVHFLLSKILRLEFLLKLINWVQLQQFTLFLLCSWSTSGCPRSWTKRFLLMLAASTLQGNWSPTASGGGGSRGLTWSTPSGGMVSGRGGEWFCVYRSWWLRSCTVV